MAKVEATQATKTLAGLAKPGVHIPDSRYDQFIRKHEDLNSSTTSEHLFSTALLGLGYLDPFTVELLKEEAERLKGLQYFDFHEAVERLGTGAEIVIAYNALDGAIADRHDRMFDNLILDSRRFAYGAVTTACVVSVEMCQAS